MRLVIALVVGVAATVQRGYFKGNNATCAKTSTVTFGDRFPAAETY